MAFQYFLADTLCITGMKFVFELQMNTSEWLKLLRCIFCIYRACCGSQMKNIKAFLGFYGFYGEFRKKEEISMRK